MIGQSVVTGRYIECRSIIDQVKEYAAVTYARHVADDVLEDQATDAFLYADKAYNPKRGMTFASFLRLCLKSRFLSIAERHARMHSLGKSTAVSISTLHLTETMEPSLLGKDGGLPDNAEHVLGLVRATASEEAHAFARAILIGGNSKTKAAKQLGLSKGRTDGLLSEIITAVFGCTGIEELEVAARRLRLVGKET
ncbi:hypothetical protein LCGC14_0446360 [marine sediment metagenome]|uniref:Uncharacterized protein n=1 Tax=marine sediment metagenome TaxID=412755 RepID=A0A0F9V5Z3_9ZZZZ